MASNDLLFEQAPLVGSPVNLVFGEVAPPPVITDAHISGTVTLRRPVLQARAALGLLVRGGATLTRPILSGVVRYYTDTRRPTVGRTRSSWQDSADSQIGTSQAWQDTTSLPSVAANRWQDGLAAATASALGFQDAARTPTAMHQRFQDADRLGTQAGSAFQDAERLRMLRGTRYQDAVRIATDRAQRYQDANRAPRKWAAVQFQDARRYSFLTDEHEGYATHLRRVSGVRFQDAMRPPIGMWQPPGPPAPIPCYTPSADLLFVEPWVANGHLVFVCEREVGPGPGPEPVVIVPVRKVYLVVNTATLIRVSDSKPIPVSSLSLSLDVDSWTWSFNASAPTKVYDDVAWQAGEPVEVLATVNGTSFRLLVESISRDRTYQRDDLRIGGRGRTALLDAPYAPVLNLFAEDALTSQQLAEWVLQDNGVPLGWGVNWGITPWLVPGGVFSLQGSYIAGLGRIAESAGAYLQPHDTADQIYVLPRYPVAPWAWASVTPDFELPAAIAQREATEWANKPYYNRVYVRGEAVGINGRVTRTGSAGDMLAPAVVDSLITHADAARQRGTAILSDVGRVTTVSLRMPVLPETGIIHPGKFVRYVEGAKSRIGITRGVQVEVALPTVWQTITVESHDEPV